MGMYKDLRIELSAVCLYELYGKMDTLLHLYIMNFCYQCVNGFYEVVSLCTL